MELKLSTIFLDIKKLNLNHSQIDITLHVLIQKLVEYAAKYDINSLEFLSDEIPNDLQAIKIYLLDRCEILSKLISEKDNGSNSLVINKVQNYVDTHYTETITLKLLSNIFFMNTAYLGRAFKEHTGMTFNVYINKLRIKHAKAMFENEDMKSNEILYSVGYNNPEYFYRAFKKYEGISFQEYKRQLHH